ncbi:MAG: phosphomannomutase/phosphoglucomutase [Clostridia bacterium]|nr:phosphomannomutase/phosphoglucomutase [Clostridia bacterium]
MDMKKAYLKLQNGSDIRGVSLTGVPGENLTLREDEAKNIAIGFIIWLSEKLDKKPGDLVLAIGHDPRGSAPRLLDGLMDGFGLYGCKVYSCGLASTPAMFMATVFPDFACDGTVMITASHLPYNRNGFKFFTRQGGLNKGDIKAILEYAADPKLQIEKLGPAPMEGKQTHRLGKLVFEPTPADIMTPYCDHLKKLIIDGVDKGPTPLAGMRITVDAGNGGGGFFATRVLKPLGADISTSQFLEPDAMFENHAPNPEDKAAMNAISMQVLAKGTDLGLIFDTDVDRSAAVDSRGREIARNGIVAMAAALVAEDHPGTTVVTDSITSRQLTSFLEKDLGLKHLRFKRGYRNVINKAIELNEAGTDCQLAIETSGHAALKENFFLDDGAYLATKIVIKAAKLFAEGKKIDSVIESLQDPADEKEIRIPISNPDFGPYGDKVLGDLKIWAQNQPGMSLESPNYEGVRINFEPVAGAEGSAAEAKGWCLLRKSLHDPLLPMNIAADIQGGAAAIEKIMREFLSDYDELEL